MDELEKKTQENEEKRLVKQAKNEEIARIKAKYH